MIKAPTIPGIHAKIVSKATTKNAFNPLSATAKGGKMIQSTIRHIATLFFLFRFANFLLFNEQNR